MNTQNISRAVAFSMLICVVWCSGCSTESTDSENVNTPGIFARMNVDALSTGSSKVTVELNVGGSNGTNISLTANERLEATNAGVTKVLNRDTDLFDIDYEVGFDDYDATSPFQVTLFRANGEIIDGSSIFLPPVFDISAPESGQSFSAAGALPIMWAPADAGRAIDLTVTTRCTTTDGSTRIAANSFSVTDDGFENFSLSQLRAVTDGTIDRTRNCEFRIALERSRSGNVDPEFGAGGSMRSRQVRSVDDMTLTF